MTKMMAACALVAVAQGCGTGKEQTDMRMLIDIKGEGAPLVLVGGGLTGWRSWVPFQEELASSRKVARAQPLSVQLGLEDRHLPADYSMDMESAALAAALDEAGLTAPLDLVGWSYGGGIALDYALDHPERIHTLTLIEPAAFWVLEATGMLDAQSRRESDELRALHRAMSDDVTEEQLATFLRDAGLVAPGEKPQEHPQWPVWVEHRRSLRVRDVEWAHVDTAARLRAFTRPVLLLKGTGSTHGLHRIVDALATALPRAQVLELPGGHAAHIASKEQFLARLAAFQADAP